MTPGAKKVIELAVDNARRLNHHSIGTEHLLRGLALEGKGIAALLLESQEVSLEKLLITTFQVRRQDFPQGEELTAIRIDNVDSPYSGVYRFPTIDFKFQNTGNATAVLWQFAIEILQAEVDQTPELDFKVHVENGNLSIEVSNLGWGAACECMVQLSEPTLNKLFTATARRYTGTLECGEQQEIICLTKDQMDRDQFYILSTDNLLEVGRPWLEFTWECKKGEKGSNFLSLKDSRLFLTEAGFSSRYDFRLGGAPMESSFTYVSIIDPRKGPHERVYPLSRQIPPGDVERFHIMLGSPMSCHFLLRFKFFVDKETVSESEVFDIKIWNPRNSNWHKHYKDGAELDRGLNTFLQAVANKGCWDEYCCYKTNTPALRGSSREDGHGRLSGLRPLLDLNSYPFEFPVLNIGYSLEVHVSKSDKELYTEAILALEQMAERVANREVFHYCKGHLLEHMQKYEEALREYKLATSFNPRLIHAWYHMGHRFFHLHRYEEALQSYRQTASLDSKQEAATWAWIHIGECLQNLHRDDEALQTYKRASQCFFNAYLPSWIWKYIWEHIGECLQNLHRDDEALQAYKRASEHPVRNP